MMGAVSATHVHRHLNAPRARVYRALIDPVQIPRWRVPRGMTCKVDHFDGREGGEYQISLTYDAADRAGKSSAHTDTYRGRFVRLVPLQLVSEVDEFETDDPALQGEMSIIITLEEAGGGTDLDALHEGLPAGVAPADNEAGWREALDRLAALVEQE